VIIQSLEELERELSKAQYKPIYLILGPEHYQCRKAVALLKNALLTPESMAFDYSEFIAGEVPVDEIIVAANTFPMISHRKTVLVNQVEQFNDSEQDLLLESIGSLSHRTILIMMAEGLDHRKRFYRTLRDEVCVAEFAKLKGSALERWSDVYVRKQGYRMSTAAIKKIVELAGSDLQNLAMELDKLLLYAGTQQNVPDVAVDDIVRGSRQQTIFELIDTVARRDRSGALRSLANLLGMGEHPLIIVTMMARHCRQVMITQEHIVRGSPAHEIGRAAQIPPFMLDKFIGQARSADSVSVKKMLVALADIDRRLKSSSADGRMLLEGLVCELV
jgi:DNA polymerase III subunit delta